MCAQQEEGVRNPRTDSARVGCLQQWHTALGGTVAASRAEGGWAGGRELRLGAVGKAGRFGGLHLEKKTRLYKGL